MAVEGGVKQGDITGFQPRSRYDSQGDTVVRTVSVRIDKDLVKAARRAGRAETRTVREQIEFWAKVGRAALDNPDLPASFIAESLMSIAEPREDGAPFG